MSENAKKYKRRQYFIKRGFQIQFIIKFCFLLIIGVIISTSLLMLFSQDTLTSTFYNSQLEVKSTALSILPAVLYTNLITLFLILVAAIAVILFVSHKIAGPMYRVEEGLKELGNGNLTQRIGFRKNDQIESMATSFNKTAENLSGKINTLLGEIEKAKKMAQELELPEEYIHKITELNEFAHRSFTVKK